MKVRTFVVILLIIGVTLGVVIGYQIPLSQISNLESELKTQQLTHKNNIDELVTINENNINYLESKISNLLKQLETKSSEITTLNQQKNDLESTISYLEDKITDEADQISILNEEIALKNMEIITIRDLLGELQKIVPSYQKGEWNQIMQFSGYGAKHTPLFNVPYNQVRVTWEYNEIDVFPYLITELYNPSETLCVWSSGILEEEYGSTYLYNLSEREYYLKINPSQGIGTWTVTIDAWIPE